MLDTRSLDPVERLLVAIATESEATSDETMMFPTLKQSKVCFRFNVSITSRSDLYEGKHYREKVLVADYLRSNHEYSSKCSRLLSDRGSPRTKELKTKTLKSFSIAEDDFSSTDEAVQLLEIFTASLYNQRDLVCLFEQAVINLTYQEFRNECAVSIERFLLKTVNVVSRPQDITNLTDIVKGRREVANLVWLRARTSNVHFSHHKQAEAEEFERLNLDDNPYPKHLRQWNPFPLATSKSGTLGIELRTRTPESSMVSTSDNPFEWLFEGRPFEDFCIRLGFVVRRAYLQLAIYDNHQNEIFSILHSKKDSAIFNWNGGLALRRLLKGPSQYNAGENQPNFESDCLSREYSEADETCMIVCGWELPRLLSSPKLSLTSDGLRTVEDLRESYEDWLFSVNNSQEPQRKAKWRMKMSALLEKICNIVVLTGAGDSVRATTCRDIITEFCGRDLGTRFLQVMMYAASGHLGLLMLFAFPSLPIIS